MKNKTTMDVEHMKKNIKAAISLVLLLIIYGCTSTMPGSSKADASVKDCSDYFLMLNNTYDMGEGVSDLVRSSLSLCYAKLLADDKDPNCNDLDDKDERFICQSYMDVYNGSIDRKIFGDITMKSFLLDPKIEYCDGDSDCITSVAIITNNDQLCSGLKLPENCQFSVAIYNLDSSFCDSLDDKNAVACMKIFNIKGRLKGEILSKESQLTDDVKNNAGICSEESSDADIANCIIRLALDNNDEGYCDSIPETTNVFQSKKGLCYGLLAVKTENLAYCDKQGTYYRNVCRMTYDRYFSEFPISAEEFIGRYV